MLNSEMNASARALCEAHGLRIVRKSESRLCWWLGLLLWPVYGVTWAKRSEGRWAKLAAFLAWPRRQPIWMTEISTTIMGAVYIDDGRFDDPSWELLTHELVHHLDRLALGTAAFMARYIGAQGFAALALLCPLGLLWWPLWFLAGALGMLAAPAPGRVDLELRAYLLSPHIRRALRRYVDPEAERARIALKMSGPTYLWPGSLGSVLREAEARDLAYLDDPPAPWAVVTEGLGIVGAAA